MALQIVRMEHFEYCQESSEVAPLSEFAEEFGLRLGVSSDGNSVVVEQVIPDGLVDTCIRCREMNTFMPHYVLTETAKTMGIELPRLGEN
jgi:hypothetical protein